MSWAHFSWLWTIEPIVLIILLSVLIKIIAFNYRQVETLTEEMYTSVVRAQTFLHKIDREFEIMNTCAKSVKGIFLNFGRVYREITAGGKSVDEAIKTSKSFIPNELKSNLSDLFNFQIEERTSSVDGRERPGLEESSSVDLGFSKIKSDSTDTEDSVYRLYVPKTSAKDIFNSMVLTRPELKTDSTNQ